MDGSIALAYAKKLYDLAEGPQGEPGSGAVGTVADAYSSSKTYAVGDYVIHNEEFYRCTTAITTAEAFTAAHWTKLVMTDEVSDLKSDINNIRISNQSDVNAFFKELLLMGVDASDISVIAFGGSASNLTINFKDSGNSNIASFSIGNTAPYTDGYIFFKSSVGTAYMVAFVDWSKLSVLFSENYNIVFSDSINDISRNPKILEKLTATSENVIIPSYTSTSSYRIKTDGTIVSAGSSWFYTSPIAVNEGDVVVLRSNGNANAIPIAYTDADASYYEAAVVYGGSEPSLYNLLIKENGYIAISGYSDAGFRFVIYKNPYIASLLAPIESRLTECEAKILEVGGDNGLPLNAIDYGIKVPKRIASADVTSVDGWQVDNGAVLSLSKKYDNINRVFRDCVTVDSQSGNGMAWFNLPEAVNANTHPLMVSICVGEYDDTDPVAGDVAIEIFSGSSRSSSYKITYVFQGSTNDGDYNPVYNHNGWFNFCMFVPSLPANKRFIDGANFDPTNVTAVGVHVYNTRGIANKAHIAELSFVPPMQKSGIVTIIDNFGTKVPDMADYAYSKGVRLSLSIIPGFYEGASGAPTCASKAELDRVAQQGHCIWNHTWAHQILNNLTYAQIQDEVNLAEKWMMLNGYGENKKFVSNPSARFNTATCNALLDSNAEMIFHKWSGASLAVYVPYYPTLRCIQTTVLDQEAVGAGLGASDLADIAEKCMTYGGITIIGFHDTFWNLDDGVSWKAYIDAISEIDGVYHYGLDEIYDGMWC